MMNAKEIVREIMVTRLISGEKVNVLKPSDISSYVEEMENVYYIENQDNNFSINLPNGESMIVSFDFNDEESNRTVTHWNLSVHNNDGIEEYSYGDKIESEDDIVEMMEQIISWVNDPTTPF